jgi:hypothetical protein
VDGQLRACALDTLQALVRSSPALRGAVLSGVARFLGSVPDEAVQVGEGQRARGKARTSHTSWALFCALGHCERRGASGLLNAHAACPPFIPLNKPRCCRAQAARECLLLLRSLMQLWLSLLLEEGRGASLGEVAAGVAASSCSAAADLAASQDGGCSSGAAADGVELDLPRLEGVLFVLLGSFDATLRQEAYEALAQARELHQRLRQHRGHAAAGGGAGASGVGVGGADVVRASGTALDASSEASFAGGNGGGAARLASRLDSRHTVLWSKDSLDFSRNLGEQGSSQT